MMNLASLSFLTLFEIQVSCSNDFNVSYGVTYSHSPYIMP